MKNFRTDLSRQIVFLFLLFTFLIFSCNPISDKTKKPFELQVEKRNVAEPISFFKSKGNWFLTVCNTNSLQLYKSTDLIYWEFDRSISFPTTLSIVRAFPNVESSAIVLAGWDSVTKKIVFKEEKQRRFEELSTLDFDSLEYWSLHYSPFVNKYFLSISSPTSNSVYTSDELRNWTVMPWDSKIDSLLRYKDQKIRSFSTLQVNNSRQIQWILEVEDADRSYYTYNGEYTNHTYNLNTEQNEEQSRHIIQSINTDKVDKRQLGLYSVIDSSRSIFISPIIELSFRTNDFVNVVSGKVIDQTKSLRKVAHEINKVVVNGYLDWSKYTNGDYFGIEAELLITKIDQSKTWKISFSNKRGEEIMLGYDHVQSKLFLSFRNHWSGIAKEESLTIKDTEMQTPFSFILTSHHVVLYHFHSGISIFIEIPISEPLIFSSFHATNGPVVAEGNIFIYN